MAVLEVMTTGHPVLKQIAEPVEFVNKKIRQLLDDMAETMYKTDGVGLAAPQVNVSKRIIVLDDGNGLIEAEGFLARIFQHEIDHLNGILFVEKLVNPNEIFIHKKEQ